MLLKHACAFGSRDVVVTSILNSTDLRPSGGGDELPVQNLKARTLAKSRKEDMSK